MIKLSPPIKEKYAYLAQAPTHAKLIHVNHTHLPDGLVITDAMRSAMPAQNQLYAIYALGTLADDGSFIPNNHAPQINTLVDLKDYSDEIVPDDAPDIFRERHEEKQKQSLAAKALLGAGTIPTPGKPHVAKKSPGKKEHDFTKFDLDTVVAHFTEELLGEPIP